MHNIGAAAEGLIGFYLLMTDAFSAARNSIAARSLRALKRLGPVGFARLFLFNVKLLVSGRLGEHSYLYDRSFDRKYGVDTSGTVEADELDASPELKARAQRYEVVEPAFFNFLLQRAGLTHCFDHLFVDLGSGKGRSLLLAALAGFPRVLGVELDRGLHSIACRNMEVFRPRCPSTEFIPILGDATTFDFPPVPTVLFLNNPFDEQVLERVLVNIERSLAETVREFSLIYMHSNHAETVRARGGWRKVDDGWFRNKRRFAIFRWRAEHRGVFVQHGTDQTPAEVRPLLPDPSE